MLNDFKLLKVNITLVFLALLGLYLFSMPYYLTLEDDGFFVMSAWFNGVSHPPGYPLHTIFTHLSTLLPVGSIPSRVHAVSALFGAMSSVCLMFIVFRLLHSRVIALLSGVLLGTSDLFWSQSIIAEVYTLNTFLYLFLVYISLLIVDSKDDQQNKRNLYYWAAFVFGLSMANHWPLIILGSSLLLILFYSDWRLIVHIFPKLLIFFFIGLLPYVWMIYRSWQEPVFSFLGEIRSFSDFMYIFLRSSYASQDQSATAIWYDKLQYLFWFFKLTLQQFLIPFSLLGLIGIIYSLSIVPRKIALSLLIGFCTLSILLIFMLGFDFEPEKQSVMRVYFLPAFSIYAIWIAFGIHAVFNFLRDKKIVNHKLVIAVIFVLVLLQTIIYFKHNNRSSDQFSLEYSTVIFNILPKDSILVVDDDISAGVFGYYHYVEKVRPDITLISSTGYAFKTRLFHPIGTELNKRNSVLSNYLLKSKRPVFATRNYPVFGNNSLINYGIVYQLALHLESKLNFKFTSYTYHFLNNLTKANYFTDSWEKGFRQYLMMKGIFWAMFYRNNDELASAGYDLKQLIENLNQSPQTSLVLYEYILLNVKEESYLKRLPDLQRYLENNIQLLSKYERNLFMKLKRKSVQKNE